MIAIVLSVAIASAVNAPEPTEQGEPLNCTAGPSSRTYAGHEWIVWGCADGRSAVFVAGKGNPAQPFYFIVTPAGKGIHLYGEGTGEKSATEPAYIELQKLSATELESILRETQSK